MASSPDADCHHRNTVQQARADSASSNDTRSFATQPTPSPGHAHGQHRQEQQQQQYGNLPSLGTVPTCTDSYWHYNVGDEVFSRKVFVGGLPMDCDEDVLQQAFGRFGKLEMDWPRNDALGAGGQPRGYVFLLYEREASVRRLVDACHKDNDKYYVLLRTGSAGSKPVQVRPWRLADAEYIVDPQQPVDPRHCVFIGGLPRPVKAVEVAAIVDKVFGGVCYVGIDTDPEHKYPKGAARVAFCYQSSYLSAISGRFVTLTHGDTPKRVEIKPYVVEDMMCDECHGSNCEGRCATIFCPDLQCLQYYCDYCWHLMHASEDSDNSYRVGHNAMHIKSNHANYYGHERGGRSDHHSRMGRYGSNQRLDQSLSRQRSTPTGGQQQQQRAGWADGRRAAVWAHADHAFRPHQQHHTGGDGRAWVPGGASTPVQQAAVAARNDVQHAAYVQHAGGQLANCDGGATVGGQRGVELGPMMGQCVPNEAPPMYGAFPMDQQYRQPSALQMESLAQILASMQQQQGLVPTTTAPPSWSTTYQP